MLRHSFNEAFPVAGDRMSSPQVAQRMLSDIAPCDIAETSSPKVEQLVISPFDEGTQQSAEVMYLPAVTVVFIICTSSSLGSPKRPDMLCPQHPSVSHARVVAQHNLSQATIPLAQWVHKHCPGFAHKDTQTESPYYIMNCAAGAYRSQVSYITGVPHPNSPTLPI